ncbi:hypothetical protein [Nonomuraea sp. NPDC003754]
MITGDWPTLVAEGLGGGGVLISQPVGEVLTAVARVGGHQPDLRPFVHPPDSEIGDGSSQRPSCRIARQVKNINEAADGESQVDLDADDARLGTQTTVPVTCCPRRSCVLSLSQACVSLALGGRWPSRRKGRGWL